MLRYFLGFLVAVGLVILLIVLIFGGHGSPKPTVKSLDSYSNTDATVKLTIDGPINAAQNHQQVVITVGNNDVTFEQIQGYDGSVGSQQTFPNTVNSYYAFLRSLEVAGYMNGNNSSTLTNYQGYCSLGDRYIFELDQSDRTLQRYWATSCGSPKSYEGNTSLTLSLFEAQVPNYATLAENDIF